MRVRRVLALATAVLSCVPLAGLAADVSAAAVVRGDYLEARTAEVHVGFCVANSEVGLAGREALLAWSVDAGSWQGMALDGLSVVAAVRAAGTLGDVGEDMPPARALIFVDEHADAAQQAALAALARELGGDLLADVVAVRAAPIEVERAPDHGLVRVAVGDLVTLEARPLRHGDGLCGNEDVFYPPLARGLEMAHPAYTLRHRFRAEGLGATWSSPEKSSAYLGSFAR